MISSLFKLRRTFAAAILLMMSGQSVAAEPLLKLNDIQVMGSHNSYRGDAPPAILAHMARTRSDAATVFGYQHPVLARQLDLGVRQIELDVFADPDGGRFADPMGEAIAPGGVDRSAMLAPGYKVLHIPGIDYRSHCVTLAVCLKQVRDWSKANPGHLPIFITIDAKDQPFSYQGATVPIPLTAALLDTLDDEIRSVLGPDMLIAPDDVRGQRRTLREAVVAGGWPSLEEVRGKVMIIFDVRRATADLYRQNHPSLVGRAMFSLYDPDDPEAATLIIQDPREAIGDIQEWVRQGFIIRTRSDADTYEARVGDRSGLEAAMASGAQMISTDYYPGAPDPEGLRFSLSLPGGIMQRCNPVRRPHGCELETRR
jgi:hypothetical protein